MEVEVEDFYSYAYFSAEQTILTVQVLAEQMGGSHDQYPLAEASGLTTSLHLGHDTWSPRWENLDHLQNADLKHLTFG